MEQFNIGITGGGAAGLISAIAAAEAGAENIALFEGNVRCGTKILMSGGTRCNVTNSSVDPGYFFGSRNFIKNVLSAFSDKMTREFFERLGLQLKLEPTGKYFPMDDDARSVLNVLLKRLDELGVKIFLNTRINSVELLKNAEGENEGFLLKTEGGSEFKAASLIVTTGGQSYPSTGSDGHGYEMVKALGHSVKQTFPALTPVLLNDPELTALSGITIPAKLTLTVKEKKQIEMEESLLIAHFGITGPAALNISREVERLKGPDTALYINFIPRFSQESLSAEMKELVRRKTDRLVVSFFKELVPNKLCLTLFQSAKVPLDKRFNNISNDELKRIVRSFTSYRLKVAGVKGFKQAEVTAGGVPLEEVKFQTMESRLVKGLYLAGEILDADGLIGGYNFQWAWSTGHIAGRSAAMQNRLMP